MGGKGSGGHNRKPSAQRKAEGNAGKRPINEAEPVPLEGSPAMPSDLSPDEKVYWHQLLAILEGMKTITSADAVALGQLCRFLAEERECTRLLNQIGRMIPKKNEQGQVIGATLNPIARLRSDAARHARSYLAVFGLGPSWRAGLVAGGKQDDLPSDPLENLRSAKAGNDIVQ